MFYVDTLFSIIIIDNCPLQSKFKNFFRNSFSSQHHISYMSVIKALRHAAIEAGVSLEIQWIESTKLEANSAAESKKDCCQTERPADECTSHFHNNNRNEIIEQIERPHWKQVAEARFKNSWTRSRQKQHLPALAEND